MSEAMDRRALLAALTGAGLGLAAAPAAALDDDKQLKDLGKAADDLADLTEEVLELAEAWEEPSPKDESAKEYDVVRGSMTKTLEVLFKALNTIGVQIPGGPVKK